VIIEQQSDGNSQQHTILLLTSARAELGLRDEKQAYDTLYEALRLNKKTNPVDKWTEADIYQLLVEIAKRGLDTRDGNYAVKKSLQARVEFFGDNSVQMAPYYEDAAAWYRISTQYGEERKQHQRTIAVLEARYGKDDVRLATPLMGVAATYMIPHKGPKKVEAALSRARALNYPDSAAATFIHARVLANLADYYIVFDDPDRSITLYREAWHLMADHAGLGADTANQFFSATTRLYFHQPDRPASSGKGADFFAEGYVLLGFDISRTGMLENVEILESRPVQMREKLFFDAAKKARYRPRVVDGEPVVNRNESMRFSYNYINR
jgi:tetratricopeptide (TPR) repeat protein